MSPSRPSVTIGIPTRNGAKTLPLALESALQQTFEGIEILVSDNASSDQTPEVVQSLTVEDKRIRFIRQTAPVTMLRNYEATWREARGDFFMWLADDDLISENFVEGAVRALEHRSDAVLAFGEQKQFYVSKGVETALVFDYYDFSTQGSPRWKRLWKDRHSGYEIKGLLRREALQGYGWYDHTVSPDWPLLTYLMLVGEVIRVPGIVLYNGWGLPESGEDRARAQSFSSIERFPMLKLSWRCGQAAREAALYRGQRSSPLPAAALTFGSLLWTKRNVLFSNAIEPIVARRQGRPSHRR